MLVSLDSHDCVAGRHAERDSRIPRRRLIESVARDSGYALRVLRKSPGFTAAVVLSLALGIGANTAIFTLMDAVLWRMLPVSDPEQPARRSGGRKARSVRTGFTYSRYRLLRDNNAVADLAGYAHRVRQRQRRRPAGAEHSGSARLGRLLLAPRREPGRSAARSVPTTTACRTAIRSRCSAMATGSGDLRAIRSVVGRTIRLSALPFTIIGVTPRGVLRRGDRDRAGRLPAAHDAADGHAGVREPAGEPDRQQDLGSGDRAHEAGRQRRAGGRGDGRGASELEEPSSPTAPAAKSVGPPPRSLGARHLRRRSRRCAGSFRGRCSSCWRWSASCC